MNKIDCSNSFLTAIQFNKKSLICNPNGTWRLEGFWEARLMRIVRWIIRPLEDARLRRITQAFTAVLDQMETQPVDFSGKNTINYSQLVDASNRLTAYLDNYVQKGKASYSLKWFLIYDINRLQQRTIALKYRCEAVNGGENPNIGHIDQTQFDQLKALAARWKNQTPFPADITQEEEQFLEEACLYPLFVENLLLDTALQDAFFKWTIRYHNPVQAFVEYPETQRKLSVSLLASRVSLYNLLRVQGSNAEEREKMGITSKDLTIPCHLENNPHATPCSILDAAKVVTFKGGYALSWQEIFKIFERKNQDFGNLEAFPTGIDNWNTSKLGWWNARTNQYVCVDLTQNDWWMQIPSTQELSLEEAQQRYHQFRQNNDSLNCDGTNWVYTIMMTRRSRTLEPGGTHGYGEIAIPVDDFSTGLKKYKVITLSLFPCKLPQSIWEIPGHMAKTFPGVVASPDLSIYVLSRERFGPSYEMTPEQGLELMGKVKRKIEEGWKQRDLSYQLFINNCQVFTEGIIRDVLGESKVPLDLSLASWDVSEPRGAIGALFNVIHRAPKPISQRIVHYIFRAAGSASSHSYADSEGNKFRFSLMGNEPWYTNRMHVPAQAMTNLLERKKSTRQ